MSFNLRRRVAEAQVSLAIHGSAMHRLLIADGFALMPFRLPRRIRPGPMKVSAVWKKTAAGIQQIVRYDFAVSGETTP